MTINNFGDYVGAVSNYIEKEYDADQFVNLTDDEKWSIRNIIETDYHYDNHINNSANNVINYLKSNRNLIKEKNK